MDVLVVQKPLKQQLKDIKQFTSLKVTLRSHLVQLAQKTKAASRPITQFPRGIISICIQTNNSKSHELDTQLQK